MKVESIFGRFNLYRNMDFISNSRYIFVYAKIRTFDRGRGICAAGVFHGNHIHCAIKMIYRQMHRFGNAVQGQYAICGNELVFVEAELV